MAWLRPQRPPVRTPTVSELDRPSPSTAKSIAKSSTLAGRDERCMRHEHRLSGEMESDMDEWLCCDPVYYESDAFFSDAALTYALPYEEPVYEPVPVYEPATNPPEAG